MNARYWYKFKLPVTFSRILRHSRMSITFLVVIDKNRHDKMGLQWFFSNPREPHGVHVLSKLQEVNKEENLKSKTINKLHMRKIWSVCFLKKAQSHIFKVLICYSTSDFSSPRRCTAQTRHNYVSDFCLPIQILFN